MEVLPENMGPRINSRYPFFLDLSDNVPDADADVDADADADVDADADADADAGIDADSPAVVSDMGNEDDTDNKVIEFVPIMSILVILIIILLYI